MVRLVLADDHDLVRAGIRAALDGMAGVEIVDEARTGDELVASAVRHRPDLALTDISMPGMNGISAIPILREHVPGMRIVVLSGLTGIDFVRRAIRQGACGYLLKDSAMTELPQAVASVMACGSYFSPAVSRALLAPVHDPLAGLTTRQVEVLRMVGAGKTAKEIAHALGLSPKTVDVHRARIMERLDIRTQPELMRFAMHAEYADAPEGNASKLLAAAAAF
jgi:two-component system, NarL family, nitrate/nitrite response regulator NarL